MQISINKKHWNQSKIPDSHWSYLETKLGNWLSSNQLKLYFCILQMIQWKLNVDIGTGDIEYNKILVVSASDQ